jgi:hypothetical protein
MASLKASGKTPPARERFTKRVIGIRRESRQDFNSFVGIMSSEQEASEELRTDISYFISGCRSKIG